MNEVLHERKTLRHKHFDYNEGVIFVTICTAGRKPILSRIGGDNVQNQGVIVGDGASTSRMRPSDLVGDGASTSRSSPIVTPKIELTKIGKIVEKYILSSSNMKGIKIGDYVIMPNHIHILVAVDGRQISANCKEMPIRDVEAPSPTDGVTFASRDVEAPFRDVETPSPTINRQNMPISHFVSVLKRLCNKEIGENIFQRSYYDHVIRSDDDLDMHIDYILHNPENWFYDELYSNE